MIGNHKEHKEHKWLRWRRSLRNYFHFGNSCLLCAANMPRHRTADLRLRRGRAVRAGCTQDLTTKDTKGTKSGMAREDSTLVCKICKTHSLSGE